MVEVGRIYKITDDQYYTGGKIVYKVLDIKPEGHFYVNIKYRIIMSNNKHYNVGDIDSWHCDIDDLNEEIDVTEFYEKPLVKLLHGL